MISTRAAIRHVNSSFTEGTTFLLAWERCESERELRLLVFLGESRSRIVVLCPDTREPADLVAHRRRIQDRCIEPYRAMLSTPAEYYGFAIPIEVYRRTHLPQHDGQSAYASRGTRMSFGAALSSHPHEYFDPTSWQSDKACLERMLDDALLYARGERLHATFKYREARRYLLRISQTFRKIDDCRLLIADTYRREGRFEQEAAVYASMAQSKSTSLLHAISLARCGRFPEALDALNWAPDGDPNTHYYRALCAAADNDFAAAADHIAEACKLAPESAEAAYCHLTYRRRNGRFLEIAKAFVAFWKASSRASVEPLDLVDMPDMHPANRTPMRARRALLSEPADIQLSERCPATKELFA